ncbi:MAG: 5'-nucleotidase C-terminal domain-containing protein [Campylobacterota bacterium]|nr:5'-nucleotidase C-terminal domain-containing protein [Campylobacterota bacterium]
MFKLSLKSTLILSSLLFSSSLFASHKVITIAGTADLQGMMESSIQKFDLDGDGKKEKIKMGGMAYIATLIKNLKKENPHTVIVSTGDDLMNKYFHVYKGKAILSLMSDAGYELYAFGNHEFDKGSQVLSQALEGTNLKPICSDLDVSTSALNGKCDALLIKEIDGVKVGFFSLMTEGLPLVTSEKFVTMTSDNVSTAKMMIKLLKEKGVHVIIALSHIGYKNDIALAKQVKGIDLIFGGHSHDYIKKPGHIHKTVIVNGGQKGIQFIKVDIPIDKTLRVLHKEVTMYKIPVSTQLTADTEIEKKVKKYQAGFPDAIVLGETKTPWNLSSEEVRKNESTVANLVNDLMREKFKVDIVLNNAGAFRGSKIYSKGKVTDTMLKEIDEFANYAYILKLKGKYFKAILERSAASYGEGGLMQVSGLKYRITLGKELQKIENKSVTKKGNRVDQIEVLQDGKWSPIDPKKIYSVLSNSFIVNHEGDGYFWFKKYGTDLVNTYATFYSIMAESIDGQKVLSPKAKDGRLKIVH